MELKTIIGLCEEAKIQSSCDFITQTQSVEENVPNV